MSALLEQAPQLQKTRPDQIAALPLGARTSPDPWSDRLRMAKVRAVPLLSAREKMEFELTPVYLHLRYESATDALAEEQSPPAPQGGPAAVASAQ
jgi:hypothetical protein